MLHALGFNLPLVEFGPLSLPISTHNPVELVVQGPVKTIASLTPFILARQLRQVSRVSAACDEALCPRLAGNRKAIRSSFNYLR